MKRVLIAFGLVGALGAVSFGIAAATDTSSSSCNSTPNTDGTITCNIQAQVDVTPPTSVVTVTTSVPGPTTTVTQTVTTTAAPPPPPPPPQTTTPPAPPPGAWAIGEGVNASNTGYAGDGVAASQLVPITGFVTYDSSFNGQTISLGAYSGGTVTISGSHITIKDCSLTYGGVANAFGFRINGAYDTIQNCTITSPAGQSMYEPVFLSPGADHDTVLNDDISRGDNLITTYGTNANITGNYLHDTETASNPGDHPDGIEIYGGGPTNIRNNRIHETNLYDSSINEAPWGSYKVAGLSVVGNFIDNGQSMTLIDNQNTSCGTDGKADQPVGDCLINTRILQNAFGGHTNPDTNMSFGPYKTLENYEGRPIVQDDAGLAANPNAIEWPTAGANANKWEETQVTTFGDPALTPDRDGQIACYDSPATFTC